MPGAITLAFNTHPALPAHSPLLVGTPFPTIVCGAALASPAVVRKCVAVCSSGVSFTAAVKCLPQLER